MKECFKDKVVLITGAKQGIGLVTAQEFARVGAKVILCDVLDMNKEVNELNSNGYKAEQYICDLSDENQVKKMIDSIVSTHGRLDCAFNNAGVQTPQRPMAEELFKRKPKLERELIRDIPKGRPGKPKEIADALMWLCSPYASFVDGAAISVDGGFTIH